MQLMSCDSYQQVACELVFDMARSDAESCYNTSEAAMYFSRTLLMTMRR